MPLKCNYGLFMCALQIGLCVCVAARRIRQKEFHINCIPFNKSTTNFDLCKLNYASLVLMMCHCANTTEHIRYYSVVAPHFSFVNGAQTRLTDTRVVFDLTK